MSCSAKESIKTWSKDLDQDLLIQQRPRQIH